ncbi:MAG: VOC family protein [Pseudomonadota bacterium]
MTGRAVLDHLVIAAASLAEGLVWADEAFGVAPAAFGKHAQMGTHNALWHLQVPGRGDAYLEIIAIDPEAAPPGRPRWFGLDDPATRERLEETPRLVAWQVQPPMPLADAIAAAKAAGVDPGEAVSLTRDALCWQLTVTSDGALAEDGRFPILIEWGDGTTHPSNSLAPGGLALDALSFAPSGGALEAALCVIGADHLALPDDTGAQALRARLRTPSGMLDL